MDFRTQVELYDKLEEVKDPALLLCNKMAAELPSICEECGLNGNCPCTKPKEPDFKCPVNRTMLGILNARGRLVSSILNNSEPWIGIDLDGTLSKNPGDDFKELEIGEPIPAMVDFVKDLIQKGVKVKIFTARMNSTNVNSAAVARSIRKWTKKHLGVPLEATAEKDYLMVGYFDDRAHQVLMDQGTLLEGLLANMEAELNTYRPIINHLAITGQLDKLLEMTGNAKGKVENEE